MAQRLKHLPGMQETWVWSLGQEDCLEKEMATHSSTLAWKIPWTKEPGRLQSMGSQRIRHDWVTSLHFTTASEKGLPQWLSGKESACSAGDTGDADLIPGSERERRKWQSSPVFLPKKSHGQRSLVSYSPWSHKESDVTEHTAQHTASENRVKHSLTYHPFMPLFLSSFFFPIYFWLHWVCIAAHWLSLVTASRGCSLVAVHRLLIAVASLVVALGL